MTTLPASLPTALAVFSFIAAPSLVTVGFAKATDNPNLRPMAISETSVAASDIEINAPHVRVRIFWAGSAPGYAGPADLSNAIRTVFAAKGVDTRIAVLDEATPGSTTLDMRAGREHFGPFPVSEAARHVEPAVQAVRFARSRLERSDDADQLFRWK
ncbi:MAG: hypothetical protein AAFR47_02465 [Pseudomonadota bacterium]